MDERLPPELRNSLHTSLLDAVSAGVENAILGRQPAGHPVLVTLDTFRVCLRVVLRITSEPMRRAVIKASEDSCRVPSGDVSAEMNAGLLVWLTTPVSPIDTLHPEGSFCHCHAPTPAPSVEHHTAPTGADVTQLRPAASRVSGISGRPLPAPVNVDG